MLKTVFIDVFKRPLYRFFIDAKKKWILIGAFVGVLIEVLKRGLYRRPKRGIFLNDMSSFYRRSRNFFLEYEGIFSRRVSGYF